MQENEFVQRAQQSAERAQEIFKQAVRLAGIKRHQIQAEGYDFDTHVTVTPKNMPNSTALCPVTYETKIGKPLINGIPAITLFEADITE